MDGWWGGIYFPGLHYWLDEPSPASVSILPTLKSAAFLPSYIHKYSFSLCYTCSPDTYSVIVIQHSTLHSTISSCPSVLCSLSDCTSRLRPPYFTVPSCTSKALAEDQAFLLLNGQISSAYKHSLPTDNSILGLELKSLRSNPKYVRIRQTPHSLILAPHFVPRKQTRPTSPADTSTIDQQNSRKDTNERRPPDCTKDTESSHSL